MSEYFIVLLLVTLPTIAISLHPQSDMKGKLLCVLSAIIITAVPFILWDVWAYERGLWAFNSQFITGVRVFGLPVEEALFFVCIPYSSLYLWLVVRDFTTFDDLKNRILNK